ncbi:aspartate/glutamate racemase family protein [Spongiivirga sp. MCCC 1A20706]|uniref:aspartate/glutamate racemase family protein n=1 Tax=Spongiivirga sp. MCCC 1A20706 TaxID=3160963 RepID=UPI00397765E7
MKTIGLIGGMGWESSKGYYEAINKKVNQLLGGSHSAKIIMVSVDFAEIEQLTFANQWEAIGDIISHSAKQLERAGAEIILLCTNLIHIVSDRIKEDVAVPFLHIADATGATIKQQGQTKVLLLGTKYTMEKDFYTKILQENYELDVVIPNAKDRNRINEIIYGELLKGIFTKTAKQEIIEIIKNAQLAGAEGVILGCTEIPLLISQSDVTIPLFDTAKIHVSKAVAWSVSNSHKLTPC